MDQLVSIIIPHFNRADLLVETIAAIEAQEYINWEVVVVDDGSTEDQWQQISKLSSEKIRIIRRDNGSKGPSRCRNLGVAESQGTYLIFVDSDDIIAPWCLSRRLKSAEDLPENDFWIFPVMLFNQKPGDMNLCWNRLEGSDDLHRFLRSDPPWHTSSALWRREAFNRVEGFNENIFYGDDADLHVRALLNGSQYVKYPNTMPDVFVRRSGSKRITNHMDEKIIESRQIRLSEGVQALRAFGANIELLRIWEGQYFVEAEFLLFNHYQPAEWISVTIEEWIINYSPSVIRKTLVKGYFWIAQATKHHAYIVLRIARRLAMKLMPSSFFPSGGRFQNWILSDVELLHLQERLQTDCTT